MLIELNAQNFTLPIKEVAKKCTKLNDYMDPVTNKIDLGNPIALAVYNSCVYHVLDNLKINIPEGHLIPTAGLRRAIVDIICREYKIKRLIEIGTGSTAIMALLFAQRGINVIATEIDIESVKLAKKSIKNNDLEDTISLYKSEGKILSWLADFPNIFPVDGVICLPPYYEVESRKMNRKRGFSGTEFELYSPGKAEDFTINIIKEALNLKDLITFLGLLWKDNKSLDIGLRFFKKNRLNPIVYSIQAGNRKRYLTISNLQT
ncbi:MAG: RlmF-related methyltransferase [Candidatus Hodarchaeales archaeon]|jgi:methylase of polypeptide subunit release factors